MTAHRNPRRSLTLIGASALLLVTAGPAAAPPGDLDPTFETDGKVTTDFAGGFDAARGVAIQDDGKIVAAGSVGGDFGLARYDPDGSLDPTFDGDGKVTTDFAGDFDEAYGVAIQSDGRIVATGCANCHTVTRVLPDPCEGVPEPCLVPDSPGSFTGLSDFALARYNADGSLDSTFDGDGKVTTDFAGDVDRAHGVAIQGGKIVAAGQARDPGLNVNFALARYNTDGSLDTGFDGDGKVTTDFDNGPDRAYALAIQGDQIVAAGSAPGDPSSTGGRPYNFALARYNSDGSLDAGFDGDGKVTTDFPQQAAPVSDFDEAHGVAIQDDQKIVAAGCSACFQVTGPVFSLARYNANGSLDSGFDGDGRVTSDFGTDGGAANGVAIQEDQKIVAAGLAFFVSTRVFALGRYNADGSLDTTFNQDGKVTTDFATSDGANGAAIQQDGRIVAAGQARDPDVNVDFAVARYRGDVEADLSITKTGPSGRVPTGRNMTYTVAVTNTSPDEASDVVVTDTLPASVTFVGAAIDLPVGFCDPPSGGVLTCHLGPIGSGVERRIYITVKPTQAGMITNSASVTSPTPDYNLANNSDSVDTAICRITSRRSSIPCG